MESLLDFEKKEAKEIKKQLAQHKDLVSKNAPGIFEDCFLVLLSNGAKIENFKVLSQLQGEDATELSQVVDIVLNVCAQVVRSGIKGSDEFKKVLEDLGLGSISAELNKVFAKHCVQRVEAMQNLYDNEHESMT